MPFEIIRDDIIKVSVDAIVNPANTSLLGGSGVDGAIHKAAGPDLLAECLSLGGCQVGEAKITKGYQLPAKFVIHTVGPLWRGGKMGEKKLLENAYRNSLELAKKHQLESIAFPLISSGLYGYPKAKAISVATATIGDFLLFNDLRVLLVVYDQSAFLLSEKLFSSITEYIDERYLEDHLEEYSLKHSRAFAEGIHSVDYQESYLKKPLGHELASLDDVMMHLDDTFSQMLLRTIDKKGMTDSETYKKANIDRKLFSKIRNDKNYQPSKPTVIAFAIALKLNLDETKDLLLRAGFALSRSSKCDIIIEYFIEQGNYNIFEINEALFAFKQKLLGV